MNASQGIPACKVIRNPGTHHVEISTAVSAARPSSELHGPGGANRSAPVGALRFAPPGPWSSLLGLAALTAVLISTWWVPGLRITLQAGIPWLAFITLCYFAWARRRASG